LSARADKLLSVKAKSQALAEQQIRFEQAKKDIKKYADLEKIADVVVPQDKDQAEAVRELVNIASANGIALTSITFPTSSLGAAPSGAATTNLNAPTTVAPTSTPNSPANKLSQLVAVKGLPGVYQLTITIVSDPNQPLQYNQIINFLSGLEQNRRTAQVTSINLQTSVNPQKLIFTLTLNEYIKP
ncbi:MAG TPA: hypothetical protein VIJ68_02615, partial [Candidatus Saccharimonadales bacterium]